MSLCVGKFAPGTASTVTSCLLAVLPGSCVPCQAVPACSLNTLCLPCSAKAVYIVQTEEASDKLREVIAPVASQFSTALTPLKSVVSLRPSWHKWVRGVCCCMRIHHCQCIYLKLTNHLSDVLQHVGWTFSMLDDE